MGISYYKTHALIPPLVHADEHLAMIPKGANLKIINSGFKIIYFFDGAGVLTLSSGERFEFAPKSLVVLPHACDQLYAAKGSKIAVKLHVLILSINPAEISRARLATLEEGTFEQGLKELLRHDLYRAMHFPDFENSQVSQLLSLIRSEHTTPQYASRLKGSALLCCLIIEIARRAREALIPPVNQLDGSHLHAVQHARLYLQKHFQSPISLGEVAWHVRFSEEHLSRVFKSETGQTVFEHLREIRLEHAKRLLLSSDKSISAISKLTGFQSDSFFCRTFKSAMGMTANAYRNAKGNLEKVKAPVAAGR